jgi:hypothetical protein
MADYKIWKSVESNGVVRDIIVLENTTQYARDTLPTSPLTTGSYQCATYKDDKSLRPAYLSRNCASLLTLTVEGLKPMTLDKKV